MVRGYRKHGGGGREPFTTVAAYSGKDGQRIWQADDFKMRSGGTSLSHGTRSRTARRLRSNSAMARSVTC